MIQSIVTSLLHPLRDFLFQISCFHCGTRLRDGEKRICSNCWNSLSRVNRNDHTFTVLRNRFAADGFIDDCVMLYYFEKGSLLQQLAHSLKYEEVTTFGYELGIRLSGLLKKSSIDLILPVPLNKRKERERGYNQCDFIARGISESLGIPMSTDALRRIKYTETQTHLNADERKMNIEGAFRVTDPMTVQGKSILVIDDIITTGSTIMEAARVLKNAGAASVIVASAGLAKLELDSSKNKNE